MVGFILAQIVFEIGTLVLHVEAGLADSIEPDYQFSQARGPSHKDELVVR
jgi:hypothetical protein